MPALVERYGPCALVAGASEGLGAAFSRALAEAGFDLVLIARREAPLHALADELRGRHARRVDVLALDLGAKELEQTLCELAREREIGLLVYNAALAVAAPFLETDLELGQRMLDVNARGPLVAAHVLGRAMAARGRGGIVFMSSLTAFWGSAWLATYGATRAFNLALGEALSHELAERGVDVVVGCAGATSTPGFVAAYAGLRAPRAMTPDQVAAQILGALPQGGAFVPGALNRLAQLSLSRLLPRAFAVRVMAGKTRALLRGER